MKKKINLLILSMSFPYPLRAGGKIRIYNLIKNLSGKCDITLLSFATEEERGFVPELKKFCKRVETVPAEKEKRFSPVHYAKCLSLMGMGMPAEMALKSSTAFRKALKKILSEESCDIIQVEFAQMLPYVLDGRNDLLSYAVWVEHEVLNQRLFKRGETSEGLWRWFWRREGRLTQRYEIEAAKRLRNAVVVSGEEAGCLRSWNPDLNVAVIPNGVDIAYYDAVKVEQEPASIIFTGWMRHFPNMDAVDFLLKEVMPLIIRKRPDVRLYLVGGPYSEHVQSIAANIPQVSLTGFVDDIRPFIKRASVSITPLRIGGGTHLKVIEAMAAGIPVVTTPVGAEGLPLKHGEHAWIAPDAEGLAEGVLQLLDDKRLRKMITSEARCLVEKEFDWSIIAKKQMEFYKQILK